MAAANNDFFEALSMLEHERGITAEYLIEKIKAAIVIAVKKNYEVEDDNVLVEIDPDSGKFNVALVQNVVADEDWYDEHAEIGITEAQKIRKTYEVGDRIITPLKTRDFGRIAAQTAKHVIRQGIRDSERGQMMQELRNRNIIFNHITYQTSHVYICRNHPLAGSREIDMEDLIQYPFITYDRSSDTNPAYTDLIVPYHQLNRVIQVSDRAASYSVMRYCQGFAVGSGYRPFDDNYSDIVSIPIKNGLRLEIGWIVRQKYTLSDTASRFVDLLMQVESVVL